MPGLQLCYPSCVKYFFSLLMPLVTFDYIPPEWSSEMVFDFYEDAKAFNTGLDGIGYDTSNFIKNTGSLYILVGIIILEYIFYKIIVLINCASN